MDAKSSGGRKRVQDALRGLQLASLQQNPFLPDVLHQPDFLLVPEFGRLIVIYLLSSKITESWTNTLAQVEDLFEVKLQCGDATAVYGLWMDDLGSLMPREMDRFRLLEGLFDRIDIVHPTEPLRSLLAIVSEGLQLRARAELAFLWQGERQRTFTNLRRYREKRFTDMVSGSRPPRVGQRGILRDIEGALSRTGIDSEKNFHIATAKDQLAGVAQRNSFKFPVAALAVGGEPVPIEILSFDKSADRTRLRYIMTKGRLIHYGAAEDRVILRGRWRRPILYVEGNLSGPGHDPYRYVRALTSVGWHLVNEISTIPEVLREDVQA